MDFTLAPEWMLDAAANIGDGNPGIPDDLLVPEISKIAYAWYFQGRDNNILKLGKLDDNLPNMQLVREDMGVTWYRHADNEHILYKESEGTLEKYYMYPKIDKPTITIKDLYSVMLDLFTLFVYYDNPFGAIPLDMEYFEALMVSGNKLLLDYEVEIVLAILAPWYHRRLRDKFMLYVYSDNVQCYYTYINPDVTKTGKDYIKYILSYMPTYLGFMLPSNSILPVHVTYPIYDVIPRDRLVPYTKLVDMKYKKDTIYAVGSNTLLERIALHLPPVVKKFP